MGSALSNAGCVATLADALGLDLHEQTVPRKYVHRASVSEVLLTGWREIGEDTFLLGSQWPRSHSFYRAVAGRHDPLMMAETIRQAGMLLSHAGYGVPTDYPFLLWNVSYQLDAAGLAVGDTPADLTLRATCRDLKFRRGVLSSLRCDAEVYRDGRRMGRGSMRLDCMPPETYARIRQQAPQSAEPAGPGLRHEHGVAADSVLIPTEHPYCWRVEADPSHPVLFDHPVDHVPGMVLGEAMRQAVGRLAGREEMVLSGLDISFVRYAEFHLPVLLRVFPGPERDGERIVRAVVEQGGETVAYGVLRLSEGVVAAQPAAAVR
ncbi:ScbA/BarX family gamma-butyrolactone biosynthesis protein [Kitasatospora sp. NPDC051853]|uniref:ScbA/BarX family gamma-butyrolactone biosynthesis protein n=1 Tax=Kitasatospora sp. NPDC051853 TaxID=3364058 RepID=UPI00378C2A4A